MGNSVVNAFKKPGVQAEVLTVVNAARTSSVQAEVERSSPPPTATGRSLSAWKKVKNILSGKKPSVQAEVPTVVIEVGEASVQAEVESSAPPNRWGRVLKKVKQILSGRKPTGADVAGTERRPAHKWAWNWKNVKNFVSGRKPTGPASPPTETETERGPLHKLASIIQANRTFCRVTQALRNVMTRPIARITPGTKLMFHVLSITTTFLALVTVVGKLKGHPVLRLAGVILTSVAIVVAVLEAARTFVMYVIGRRGG